MTLVNWERLPGETVEEFVAAMLLLRHPHGNQITPSRGDRGVDIRVANPDGYDIYQVKRFCRPLTSRQVTDVENSWQRFVDETLPVLPVRSWTLVTPWNPTHERLERLTADSGLRISWMDRDHLDGGRPTAFVRYLQLNERHYLVMRLVARAVESFGLRPITGSLELQVPVDSAERQAVEEFLHYGAPFADIDGTITHSSEPPGLPDESGPGRLSFMVAAGAAGDRPDLEVRLVAADGTVLHALDLVQVRASRGSPAAWLHRPSIDHRRIGRRGPRRSRCARRRAADRIAPHHAGRRPSSSS